MVKDHSEEKPVEVTIWGTIFDYQQWFIPDRTAHTMAFVMPVVEH